MPESLRLLIDEGSKTAEARRLARDVALGMGFGENLAEQVSIVVTEACTNLLKHAQRGELIVHSVTEGLGPVPFLELLVLDHGPGIEDLSRCLENGYSTSGVAQQRAADKQVSTSSGTINSIRSFGAGPTITFLVTVNQQVTSTQPTTTASTKYAVTMVTSGGAWLVNDIELSTLGNQ